MTINRLRFWYGFAGNRAVCVFRLVLTRLFQCYEIFVTIKQNSGLAEFRGICDGCGIPCIPQTEFSFKIDLYDSGGNGL